MKNQETAQTEKNISNTGWQNIGICKKFARHKVPFKLRTLWLELVEDSFGYLERKTKRISQEEMSKLYGISRPALSEQLKKLEELELIKIIPQNTYVKGGGSEACAYAPKFPETFGHIKFNDEESGTSNKNKTKVQDKNEEIQPYKNVDF